MRVVTPWLDLPNVPDAWCRRLTACHAGAQTAGAFFPRPRHEITQVHDLALTALARGRVMVIYIDGLGYSLYRRATLPAIKKRFRCHRARTAFPPLTQPCMASMLTGLWPAQHGIWSRRDHHPRGASLLAVPGAVLVEADSELLSLVWNNLFSNAVKFTEPGGTLSLTLEAQEDLAVVRVGDTGCGIPPEVGKHIFEKFYQGDTSHATQGNGLGLALVKRVMDIVGGDISVESQVGVGSVFAVKLRRKRDGLEETAP